MPIDICLQKFVYKVWLSHPSSRSSSLKASYLANTRLSAPLLPLPLPPQDSPSSNFAHLPLPLSLALPLKTAEDGSLILNTPFPELSPHLAQTLKYPQSSFHTPLPSTIYSNLRIHDHILTAAPRPLHLDFFNFCTQFMIS